MDVPRVDGGDANPRSHRPLSEVTAHVTGGPLARSGWGLSVATQSVSAYSPGGMSDYLAPPKATVTKPHGQGGGRRSPRIRGSGFGNFELLSISEVYKNPCNNGTLVTVINNIVNRESRPRVPYDVSGLSLVGPGGRAPANAVVAKAVPATVRSRSSMGGANPGLTVTAFRQPL